MYTQNQYRAGVEVVDAADLVIARIDTRTMMLAEAGQGAAADDLALRRLLIAFRDKLKADLRTNAPGYVARRGFAR